MEAGEIDRLIHFWEQHLFRNRSFMVISLVWQIEQTIKSLKELKELKA